ncbi:hypothetical protein BpHYR1_000152 [Brachionus plicatilis]|uniref:Uncharacterized protein n=1 Tax=Brachionus plicatilis TaxID=10195 RepID=A0A3M7SDB1_BRAPC|nr:hypothetical protein BpHYR1_000152 [Brachionus plicatilis]
MSILFKFSLIRAKFHSEKNKLKKLENYFGVGKFVKSWNEQIFDAVPCSIERKSFDQENCKQ